MIYKVSTAWVKAINTSSFVSAWTEMVNAIRGSWGDVNFEVLEGVKVRFDLQQSYFYGEFFTDLEGDVTLKCPYEPINSTKIIVNTLTGAQVSNQITYILGSGKELSLTLEEGTKLISIQGKARRT